MKIKYCTWGAISHRFQPWSCVAWVYFSLPAALLREACDHHLCHMVLHSWVSVSEIASIHICKHWQDVVPSLSYSISASVTRWNASTSPEDKVLSSFWIHFTFSSLGQKGPIHNKVQRNKHNLKRKHSDLAPVLKFVGTQTQFIYHIHLQSQII